MASKPLRGVLDDDLYRDPALARFYDLGDRPRADFDYCRTLAAGAASILDLGCGTGALAISLARDRSVTGVDPAAAMLDIARERPGGENVTWIEGDGRTVRLGDRFDLVLLTGHAFQVFLSDDDQRAVLQTIAEHLKPDGRFIFDTRNPDFPARKERTRGETLHQIDHPTLGPIEAWNESAYDTDSRILTYTNGFRVLRTNETHAGSAQIRYTAKARLAAMIGSAGLAVERWLGDWHGGRYRPTAREIIPFGHLA